MSQEQVIDFCKRLNEDPQLCTEYERLMSDNISLIVIVKLAKREGFEFTTREFAEHIIRSSAVPQKEPQRIPAFLHS